MKITLHITPSQANNLPSPLREEVLQEASRRLKREENRIEREIHLHQQHISFLAQEKTQLSDWEELLG